MIRVAENKYGKSRVRLVQVKRKARWHDLREWTVEVLLQGDFDSCFVEGDNSKILPTDTMKNTVYSLARNSAAECMEDFAKELIDFLLRRNPQVSAAEVSIAEKAWEHLAERRKASPDDLSSGERRKPDHQSDANSRPAIFPSTFGSRKSCHHEDVGIRL